MKDSKYATGLFGLAFIIGIPALAVMFTHHFLAGLFLFAISAILGCTGHYLERDDSPPMRFLTDLKKRYGGKDMAA